MRSFVPVAIKLGFLVVISAVAAQGQYYPAYGAQNQGGLGGLLGGLLGTLQGGRGGNGQMMNMMNGQPGAGGLNDVLNNVPQYLSGFLNGGSGAYNGMNPMQMMSSNGFGYGYGMNDQFPNQFMNGQQGQNPLSSLTSGLNLNGLTSGLTNSLPQPLNGIAQNLQRTVSSVGQQLQRTLSG